MQDGKEENIDRYLISMVDGWKERLALLRTFLLKGTPTTQAQIQILKENSIYK